MERNEPQQVYDLAMSDGYVYVSDFMKRKIQTAQSKLLTVDPANSTEIAALQREISSLTSVFNFVQKRIDAVLEQ